MIRTQSAAERARAFAPRLVEDKSEERNKSGFDISPDLMTQGRAAAGGEGGIRTPDTVARMPHFECGAFNHSATSPNKAQRLKRRAAYLTARAERHKKGNQNRRNMERPEARCDVTESLAQMAGGAPRP